MNILDVDGLRFVEVLSREIDDKFKKDFIKVYYEVFGENAMNEFLFDRKYIENIYGDSILVVVYSNSIPVAARAFWRNDINGKKAYQPVDTCVTQQFRRRGIFEKMTNIALKMIKEEDIVYNFPNKNSYPQYIKLGWKNLISYRSTIMISSNQYKKEHPEVIDREYLKWWIIPKRHKFLVYKKRNDTYLVTKGRPIGRLKGILNRYFVVGRINSDMEHYFQKISTKYPILIYLGAGKKFYNKKHDPLNVVVKSSHDVKIIKMPIYKIDVIYNW